VIAIDSSSLRRFLDGERTAKDVVLVRAALRSRDAFLPPIAVAELFSERDLDDESRATIVELPLLPIQPGYWARTGDLRARLLRLGRKAKLADCLIAQSCIDNDAPLITYDRDFRHFENAGLKLL
jgi:hypothetical protein